MQKLWDDDYVTKNQVANEGNVHVWVNVINMEDISKSNQLSFNQLFGCFHSTLNKIAYNNASCTWKHWDQKKMHKYFLPSHWSHGQKQWNHGQRLWITSMLCKSRLKIIATKFKSRLKIVTTKFKKTTSSIWNIKIQKIQKTSENIIVNILFNLSITMSGTFIHDENLMPHPLNFKSILLDKEWLNNNKQGNNYVHNSTIQFWFKL